MNTLYKFASGLNAIILFLTLFLFGVMLALSGAFGSPQPTKEAIAESGVYETFVGEAVDDAGGSIQGIINFEPEIRDVIVQAALPYVREDFEQGVDNLFAWLKDTSQPVNFNIDAIEAREAVSTAVGNYVADETISSLPVCDRTPAGFNPNNPFLWECQPSNLNLESYRASFTELVSGEEFWEESTFTLDDVTGVSEQELTEDYQTAANVYSAAQTATWLLGVIVVLSIIATWMLAPTLRQTLRRVGVNFILVGIVLAAMGFIANMLMDQFLDNFDTDDALEVATASIAESIGNHVASWWRWSGIIGIILGVIMFVGAFFVKGRFSAPSPSDPDLIGVDQS